MYIYKMFRYIQINQNKCQNNDEILSKSQQEIGHALLTTIATLTSDHKQLLFKVVAPWPWL